MNWWDSLLAEVEEEAKAGHGGILHGRLGMGALLPHGSSGMGGQLLHGSFPGEALAGRHMLTWACDDQQRQLDLRNDTMKLNMEKFK